MQYQVTEYEEIKRVYTVSAQNLSDAQYKAREHAQSRTADEDKEETVGSSFTFEVGD